jgi:exodeoxyribonuclease-3
MAYRKKADYILEHKPDILIVPECEHPDKLRFAKETLQPTGVVWRGTNTNKGLGVFSYSGYKLKLLNEYNPRLRTILPIKVWKGSTNFILIAVWAYNPSDKGYNYIGQVWKAIHHYENILKSKKIIVAGDFNSNCIWDKLNRKTNHSMVVEKLKLLNITSAYHHRLGMQQGLEVHPTFYLYRHQDKPYHIDYCFASDQLMNKISALEVGSYEKWKMYSDHSPLMVSFDF